jgi:hypothetical protein
MRMDPNTAGFVYATAFLTAFLFAIGVFLPVLVFLHWLF